MAAGRRGVSIYPELLVELVRVYIKIEFSQCKPNQLQLYSSTQGATTSSDIIISQTPHCPIHIHHNLNTQHYLYQNMSTINYYTAHNSEYPPCAHARTLFLQSLGMCSGCGQLLNRYNPVATSSTSRRHTPRMRMGYQDGVGRFGVSAGTVVFESE